VNARSRDIGLTTGDVWMTLNAREGVTQVADNPLQHLGFLGPAHS
jgi:hypothetical protein